MRHDEAPPSNLVFLIHKINLNRAKNKMNPKFFKLGFFFFLKKTHREKEKDQDLSLQHEVRAYNDITMRMHASCNLFRSRSHSLHWRIKGGRLEFSWIFTLGGDDGLSGNSF